MKSIEDRVLRMYRVAKHPMTPFLVRMWMNETEPRNHAKFPESNIAYPPVTNEQVAAACIRLMKKGALKEVPADGYYRRETVGRIYALA